MGNSPALLAKTVPALNNGATVNQQAIADDTFTICLN
jgi:hypothetical protein